MIPQLIFCVLWLSPCFFPQGPWISEVSGLKAILASPELELVAGNQVGMG